MEIKEFINYNNQLSNLFKIDKVNIHDILVHFFNDSNLSIRTDRTTHYPIIGFFCKNFCIIEYCLKYNRFWVSYEKLWKYLETDKLSQDEIGIIFKTYLYKYYYFNHKKFKIPNFICVGRFDGVEHGIGVFPECNYIGIFPNIILNKKNEIFGQFFNIKKCSFNQLKSYSKHDRFIRY